MRGSSRRASGTNSLDELFAACDFITVHVPMTDKTRGMIGRRALSLCKKGRAHRKLRARRVG